MRVASANTPVPDRRRAAAWGIVFGYGGTALAIARNILLVPLYLRYVSIVEYGAWLATGAAIVQLLVSDFGLAGVLMQRSAALHGAGHSTRLGGIIGSGLLAGLGLAVALLVLGMLIVPFLPAMEGLTPAQVDRTRQCLQLALVAGALGIVAAISQGLIRSLQHGATAGAIGFAADLANILLLVVLLFGGAGIYALVWGVFARSLIIAAVSTVWLLATCRNRVPLAFSLDETRGLFKDAGTSLVSTLAMKAQTQSNTLLVGIMLGPTSAAVYGLTVRAHETVLMFLGHMNAAFAPAMAHLWGSGNVARFRVLVRHIALGSALLAAIGMACVAAVNESFLRLWIPHAAFGGSATSVLMAVAIWTSLVGYIAYDALYALAKFRLIAGTYVLTAMLHVVLLVALLRFGLWVAPLVTLATAASWGFVFWRKVVEQTGFERDGIRTLATDLLTIPACAVLVAGGMVALYPRVDSWPGLLAVAICCALVLATMVLLVSSRIRGIVHGEISMTLRSLAPRHGA
jgi:O-antigen/teichoic acid export membrane protein